MQSAPKPSLRPRVRHRLPASGEARQGAGLTDAFAAPGRAARPILIAGPTAVGKSAVAMALATRLGGEIVSVDSMQVYRGLDIGTAKPSPADRTLVPHHLIDVLDVDQTFDAAQFVTQAQQAVADIERRGRVAILCGGTGLYFRAFREGLCETPEVDPALRAELESTPMSVLLGELERRDPVMFGAIDRKNRRRVVRALEVIRLTGRPFSAQRQQWNRDSPAGNPDLFFGLSRLNEDLQSRIDARVDDMFARGLVSETERLLERGLARNRTALQAIGYRQAAEHLRGERSLEETVALVKRRTRQFAKRQIAWFRRQAGLQWVQVAPGDSPGAVADQLAAGIRAS